MTNQSGQQIAKDNLIKFKAWIVERDAANDWQDYMRADKLNRSEIAKECGFALSVLRQNPAVKSALESVETRLADISLTQKQQSKTKTINAHSDEVVFKRIMRAKGGAEARVKVLEEQNATLKAEVASLRERLRRLEYLDDHLGRTGRFLPA